MFLFKITPTFKICLKLLKIAQKFYLYTKLFIWGYLLYIHAPISLSCASPNLNLRTSDSLAKGDNSDKSVDFLCQIWSTLKGKVDGVRKRNPKVIKVVSLRKMVEIANGLIKLSDSFIKYLSVDYLYISCNRRGLTSRVNKILVVSCTIFPNSQSFTHIDRIST